MTTKTRFTLGPWRGSDGFPMFIEREDGMPIAVTHPHYIAGNRADPGVDCPTLDECEYNGVLIASAPDLYAALERVLDVYGLGDKGHLEIYEDAAEDFRKATGRMAPGKDSSPQAYVSEEHNAETSTMWAEFCTKRRDDAFVAARAALRKARGEA